jgi:peroxiredoxin
MKLILMLGYLVAAVAAQAGTGATAALIEGEYRERMERWGMRLQTAIGDDAKRAVMAARPDAAEFGRRMWIEIGTSLRQEWTLRYTPWLLENAPRFAGTEKVGRMGRTAVEEIRRVTEQMHTKNPQVGRLCLSLTAFPEPETLALVRKIEQENPDPKVQGQAAMALALLMKHLGDDPGVMKQRLTHLKSAIIKAADVPVGDTTVAKLAEEEIYVILNLSKGRTAPDVIGRDSAGKAMSLSSLRGKVVVLLFWEENMRDAKKTVNLVQKLQTAMAGKPVEVVGVNGDSLETLRDLRGKSLVTWRSISDPDERIAKQYRVTRKPWVYLIDQRGAIQYVGTPGAFLDLAVEGLVAPPRAAGR